MSAPPPAESSASSSATLLTPMEQLLGPELLTPTKAPGADTGQFTKRSTKKLLQDKEFVALYFSASWCPPCRAFSPLLKTFYQQHAAKNKLEIVYVSSDKSLEEFDAYYKTMPWLAIPTDASAATYKNQLATRLGIRGIPSLIVLQVKTGLFVTNQAREQIQSIPQGGGSSSEAAAAKTLMDTWKATEPVTLEQGAAKANEFKFPTIQSLIMAVLKNPIYIFGLLYMYKQLVKHYTKWAASGGAHGNDAAVLEDAVAEEPEF